MDHLISGEGGELEEMGMVGAADEAVRQKSCSTAVFERAGNVFSCQWAGGDIFRLSVGGEKYWSRQWGNWEEVIFCANGMAVRSFHGGNTAVMNIF